MTKKPSRPGARSRGGRRKYVKPRMTKHGILSQTALARSY